MSRLIKKWPLSATHEIIWMGFVGMGLTAVEESCTDLQQSLYHIWTQTFPYDNFSVETQEVIKSILSGIVLVRSVTVHLYFFSYFAMLLMAIFEEVPFLALPWLAVSLIRNFLLDMLTFLSGIFVCIRYDLAPVCYEFIIYKMCEMGVSVYLWLSVLKLCQDISFPDISPGDLVLMRAECVPRRVKDQDDTVEIEIRLEEEEEESELDGDETEEEGVQASTLSRKFLNQEAQKLGFTPDLEESTPEIDDIEDADSEDEEVQVNTISETFLNEASEKHGMIFAGAQETSDETGGMGFEDEDVQIRTLSVGFLGQTSGMQGRISPDAEDRAGVDEVDEIEGMKSEEVQVDTLSKEFLDQAEECACNRKPSIEIQVNTVSYTFLNEEAEKMGMMSEEGFKTLEADTTATS